MQVPVPYIGSFTLILYLLRLRLRYMQCTVLLSYNPMQRGFDALALRGLFPQQSPSVYRDYLHSYSPYFLRRPRRS